jgi:hypothetical protein
MIYNLFLPLPLELATLDKVRNALYTQRLHKALGADSIPTIFLREIGEPLIKATTALANAYLRTGYYLENFKRARTIVLRKPGKGSYDTPGS